MAKINALMGSDAPTVVKIACVLDGRVKKTLEVRFFVFFLVFFLKLLLGQVEAIDGIINGRSIQIAWNLNPEQELHVTFVGLRAPNGEVGMMCLLVSWFEIFLSFIRRFRLRRVKKCRGRTFPFGRK